MHVIEKALECKESGEAKTIFFNLSGHGNFDLAAYEEYLAGNLQDFEYTDDMLAQGLSRITSYNVCYTKLLRVKRYEESQEIIVKLIKNNKDKSSMLAIKIRELYLYHYQRDHRKTLYTGRQILKSLGFGFGKYRLPFDLIKSRIIYSKKKIESLKIASDVQNAKADIILDTLRIMNSSAAVSDDTLV